jgi:hypothetical protein
MSICKMTSEQSVNLTKWQVNTVSIKQNENLIKCLFAKMKI